MERCRRGDAPRCETSAFLGSFTPRSGKECDEDEEEDHRDAYNYPDPVKGQPQRYLVEKFGGGLRVRPASDDGTEVEVGSKPLGVVDRRRRDYQLPAPWVLPVEKQREGHQYPFGQGVEGSVEVQIALRTGLLEGEVGFGGADHQVQYQPRAEHDRGNEGDQQRR